jgi:hypothetical protein
VYEYDQLDGNGCNVVDLHSIDSSIETLSINQSVSSPPFRPCLTHNQWHSLSDDSGVEMSITPLSGGERVISDWIDWLDYKAWSVLIMTW